MKFFRISPLTQKRLERFRRSRVAFWSLCLLCLLYVLSLGAELICNDKPLVMRYDGELSFPFLRERPPQAVLDATGEMVYVNYRDFARSDRFLSDPGNFALFAPVPYGPHETLDTRDMEREKVVTLSLTPTQPVARFNLTPDLRIVRQDSLAQFFPAGTGERALRDGQAGLEDFVSVTPRLRDEIARRFAGGGGAAFEAEVSPVSGRALPWRRLRLSLAPEAVGQGAGRTLRVVVRGTGEAFLPTLTFAFTRVFDENGRPGRPVPLEGAGPAAPLPEGLGEKLEEWASMSFYDTLEDGTPVVGGVALPTGAPVPKGAFVRPASDITSADALSWVGPSGVRYEVTSGNNIRFPFPPSRDHLFGLDASGRDVFTRIVYATRIAVSFGLLLAVSATVIGMAIGAMQGYFGGKVDICVQRFTEIWAALPFLYIMVLVGAVFGRSFWLLLLVYGLFCWLSLSYYMRAEFLRLRGRPFVAAARCQGFGNARIIFRHILPNALTPIITLFPFLLVGAISALVSLDFLGFGLPPLTPSWGELLNQAQTYRWAWWLILFPSLAIFTVMFLTVMVGEGVRNAFDPKPFSKLQ